MLLIRIITFAPSDLQSERLCGITLHLSKPETHVYVLTMESELLELNVYRLECAMVFDLNKELKTKGVESRLQILLFLLRETGGVLN